MHSAVPPPLPPEVQAELFSARRLPGLSRHGAELLHWLHAHPCAPLYRNYSGHRLQPWDVLQARWRRAWIERAALPPPGHALQPAPPAWLVRWTQAVWPRLPWRRRQSLRPPASWQEILPSQRADLSAALAEHVLWDPRRVDELICFATSGSTGHPLRVPALPRVAADHQAHHRRALAHFGLLPLHARRGQVGIVLAGHQQRCFTYVSVNPLQDDCGLVKLNLMPHEWRHPDDRARYLDALAPELISGDPVSLAALAALPLAHRPRALLSTSMALSPALRAQWEARFGCPVLDLYSLNEVGPVGVFDPVLDGFVPLQPRLYIELLDDSGHRVLPGVRGEIVVSGGFNPCLPLLRYRTGDHACWAATADGWVLRDLQGRAPVRFRDARGGWVNNIEISQALRPLPLARFALHQAADDRLTLRVDAPDLGTLQAALRGAMHACLGPLPLEIVALGAEDKVRQYTRDGGKKGNEDSWRNTSGEEGTVTY